MTKRFYHPLGTACLARDEANSDEIKRREGELIALRKVAHFERSQKSLERLKRLSRLPARERIALLFDDDSVALPLMTLCEGSENAQSKSAGVLVSIGKVKGRFVIAIANDNTQAAGAWYERGPQKIVRAQTMALKLRIPVVYLVECSGLYLPLAHEAFAGHCGAGAIFKMQARLMRSGIAQLASVFGDSIAGGGYLPIMTDFVVMTEEANILIGGDAISQTAKGQRIEAKRIGGADVHVHLSHSADLRVANDESAIHKLRAKIEDLPSSGANYYRVEAIASQFSALESYYILPTDLSQGFDLRELVARWVDASVVSEIQPHFGQEIFACVGHIDGLALVFIGNSGTNHRNSEGNLQAGSILYADGITKMQRIVRACAEDGLPIVWLQDVAGFDVGAQAEKSALLALGANLLYENANNPHPQMTILLRKASGAGYYAMGGLPFEPAIQLSTVLAQETVMSAETLTSAVFAKKIARAKETGDEKELESLALEYEELKGRVETQAKPETNAAQLYTDEVVCLSEIPLFLRAFAEMSYQSPTRFKARRLWRLNDL